jgi:hypothetical protein
MMTDVNKEENIPQDSGRKESEKEDSTTTVEGGDGRRRKYETILEESIDRMVAFSRKLDDLIDSTNSKNLPSLVNTRTRVQSELTYLIIVAMNPKLKLTPDSIRDRDLARLIQMAASETQEEKVPGSEESQGSVPSN